MIILIAAVGVLISFFSVKAILGDQTTELQKAPAIEEIQPTVTPPDSRIFNSNAINPSVEVEIEGTAQQTPDTQTDNTEE